MNYFCRKNLLMLLSVFLLFFLISCTSTSIMSVISPKFSFTKHSKIAIVYHSTSQYDMRFKDFVEMQFLDMGFDLITRDHLNKILNEQGLSLAGITDESAMVKIGKLAGASAIVVLRHHKKSGGFTKDASIKLLDVETGGTLISANYAIKLGLYESPSDVAIKLGEEIKTKLNN